MSGSKSLEELPLLVRSPSSATLEVSESLPTNTNEAELKFNKYKTKWGREVQAAVSGKFLEYYWIDSK